MATSMNDIIVSAIRTFLQTYPLTVPAIQDQQEHSSATEKVGTVILPLWQTTSTLHPGSLHWAAYKSFLCAIKDFIDSASECLQEESPFDHGDAIETFNSRPTPTIPYSEANKCFETMRLSANLALVGHRLSTTHESTDAVLTPFGYFVGGNIVVANHPGMVMNACDSRYVSTSLVLQVEPFEGRGIRLSCSCRR
jgi:hypothetical protein